MEAKLIRLFIGFVLYLAAIWISEASEKKHTGDEPFRMEQLDETEIAGRLKNISALDDLRKPGCAVGCFAFTLIVLGALFSLVEPGTPAWYIWAGLFFMRLSARWSSAGGWPLSWAGWPLVSVWPIWVTPFRAIRSSWYSVSAAGSGPKYVPPAQGHESESPLAGPPARPLGRGTRAEKHPFADARESRV